jgi:LysR family transcriptional regulator, glycine cleavage system transcriptional activator
MYWRDLPNLGFLPAFEAAGRLGSFKAAAAELHLTPAAVSQQIKLLEESLGSVLFERSGRTASLSPAGRAYLQEVSAALFRLSDASRRARGGQERKLVRVSVAPLASHEFLVPRLAALRARLPEFELHIETAMQWSDLDVNGVDAAIRVGARPSPGLTVRVFGSMIGAPVCSPAIAREVRCLSDLCGHPLIELKGYPQMGMRSVLQAQGLSLAPEQIWTFENVLDALGAAEHGLGVGVGAFPVLTPWVLSGRLAVPLAHRHTLADVALVHRDGDEARFPFVDLAAWLKEQYEALPSLAEGAIEASGLSISRGTEPKGELVAASRSSKKI